jgi:hypothetical protein
LPKQRPAGVVLVERAAGGETMKHRTGLPGGTSVQEIDQRFATAFIFKPFRRRGHGR